MKRLTVIVAAGLLAAACGGGDDAGSGSGAVLPVGVYACDEPMMLGGMVVPNPQTGPMFAVTGPGRYRDFDGGVGRFDLQGGILMMTSGPLSGTRYQQDPEMETYFKVMGADGQPGETRCVLSPDKPINGPW